MKTKLLPVIAVLLLAIPAAAQEKVVPIVDMLTGGLLGGVVGGKFVDAQTAFEANQKPIRFDLLLRSGGIKLKEAAIRPPAVPCEDYYSVDNDSFRLPGVAIGGQLPWNPQPRKTTRPVWTNDPNYVAIVRRLLEAEGYKKPKIKIQRGFRVDLDGDGKDEVLIVASTFGDRAPTSAKPGDYSFVLLRKIVGDKVRDVMIQSEFIKADVDFGAPMRFDVSAIADLDGDGEMEIVVFGEYYEGAGAGVFRVEKNGDATRVATLGASCGV